MTDSDNSRVLVLPDLSDLNFVDSNHTYWLNGVQIPSVSKLMEPLKASGYAGVSERTLQNAADKGSAVHSCIENWLNYGVEDIGSTYRPYFDGFLEWHEKYQPQVISTEMQIYHKFMLYGGTVDLLAYLRNEDGEDELSLIDYKTTYKLMDKSCGVQLEAYSQALASHGIRVDRKYILHLRKDGSWEFREYPAKDMKRLEVLRSLKCVYDYTVA